MKIIKIMLISPLLISLVGCASFHRTPIVTTVPHPLNYTPWVYQKPAYTLPYQPEYKPPTYPPPYQRADVSRISWGEMSYLAQGKRYFEQGYFKRAMHTLLPLACDGIPEAQYAVGYMYYYGYGVAQDTDVGYIWMQRAAANGFTQAIQAVIIIHRDKDAEFKLQDRLTGTHVN